MAEGKHEYTPSREEIAEAEQRLTPEQAVASNARYDVLKNREIFLKVGLAEDKIKEAAQLAQEKAVAEYRELERREPWRRTMDILENVKPKLSEPERMLLSGHLQWAKEFVVKWKEEFEKIQMNKEKDLSAREVVNLVWHIYNGHAPIGGFIRAPDDPRAYYPSIQLMREKYRRVVDETAELSKWNEILSPTKDGIQKVFEEFAAEFPRRIKTTRDEGADELIPTQFPGVYLNIVHTGSEYALSLSFSPEVLKQMVETHEELSKTELK